MENNYTIDCLLYRYQNVDWTDKNNWKLYDNIFPDRLNRYDGISIHPFEVVFHKWYWSDHKNDLIFYDYCKKYSDWKLNIKYEKINVINEIQYYPMSLYSRPNIINLPDFNLKYDAKTGLCNQLFALVNGIIKCNRQNKKYILIDSFFCCVEQQNICPISKIINLIETTRNINQISQLSEIKLFDRSLFEMNIKKASYGINNVKTIDVTDKICDLYDSNITLEQNMNTYFNDDPCVGMEKYLYVDYVINNHSINHVFNNIFNEQCKNFENNFKKSFIVEEMFLNKKSDFSWYNVINEPLFISVLQKIKFTDKFYNIFNMIKQLYNLDNNITVVHFRIEPDAIKHWSVKNKMTYEVFEQKLYDKYNYLINKYTTNNDRIYILSYDEKYIMKKFNDIHTFIKIHTDIKKKLLINYYGMAGRELLAIIDLLIGINCSKLFIGCHSFKHNRGSSFSYTIANNINCKKILIDLDNINENEEVYEK